MRSSTRCPGAAASAALSVLLTVTALLACVVTRFTWDPHLTASAPFTVTAVAAAAKGPPGPGGA
ncbi:hypothetical protein, partial [Streptomyces sp. NPDC001719]